MGIDPRRQIWPSLATILLLAASCCYSHSQVSVSNGPTVSALTSCALQLAEGLAEEVQVTTPVVMVELTGMDYMDRPLVEMMHSPNPQEPGAWEGSKFTVVLRPRLTSVTLHSRIVTTTTTGQRILVVARSGDENLLEAFTEYLGLPLPCDPGVSFDTLNTTDPQKMRAGVDPEYIWKHCHNGIWSFVDTYNDAAQISMENGHLVFKFDTALSVRALRLVGRGVGGWDLEQRRVGY